CTALSWFWSIRGYSREGQHFLEQALALRESVGVPVKARALYTAADLAFLLDDTERTEKLGSESLHLFRELGDKAGMADGLFLLARYRCCQQPDRAEPHAVAGDRRSLGKSLPARPVRTAHAPARRPGTGSCPLRGEQEFLQTSRGSGRYGRSAHRIGERYHD